ncbi:MAG TPA: serine hydrolase domain-containing protein [Pyrinomonadaceae bacterium]|nr:serine hydrolase domain-containing protein [Pyrinomonadaceae bacterium]
MKLLNRSLFSLSFVLLAAVSFAHADALDDRIRSIMAERHIPGAAVAVVQNGKVVRMKGYGVATLEFNVPVTTETVFEIGSVSKQMTAAGIMLLVQDGKVLLDEKISKYLPNTPEAWSSVTVRHLLTHTSGVKSYSSLDGFSLSERMTLNDFIKKLSPHPLEFTPGEKNIYSNSGFNLLAYIIETQSGKKYMDFMRERIFVPLGMTKTGDRDPQFIIPLRANGYEWRQNHFSGRDGDLTDLMGAGSIVSTITDMTKWEAALRGDKLLNAQSKKEIWTQFTFNNGKPSPYGFGWRISEVRGSKLIGHTGQTAGFGAAIFRYIDSDITVIALTNLGEVGMGSIVATTAAKEYIPKLSLKGINTAVSADPVLLANIEKSLRGRYEGRFDQSLFTTSAAQSLTSQRSKNLNERLAQFAPIVRVKFFKRESIDGRDTISAIVETAKRVFLWRVIVDENGKISEMNIDEEE